jgi:hydroxyacylglutathione hydrolase
MAAELHIQTLVSLPFEENSYVLWRADQDQALVIDPGLEPELILNFLAQEQLSVAAILNTHGHADHIGGNAALKRAFPQAPLIIGAQEASLLTDPQANLSAPFGFPVVSPPADRLVHDGEVLTLAGIQLEVREIPGHTPGHVVYLVFGGPLRVFGGDVLFRGSIGRTDFPGGDFDRLASGIRQRLYSLPDDTVIYPGHGPVTTIGQEKRENPFVPG